MANTKPEILPFAVDNSSDCESYLFLNHPTAYISLTSNPSEEYHSPPLSPSTTTTPKSILKPSKPATVTFATPAVTTTTTAAPPMERKASTASTASDLSTCTEDDGFLGGGALRHVSGSHHLRELAELAQLDREAKAKREQMTPVGNKAVRKPGQETKHQDWLASVMQWWPENLEMAEHEWTEEFYD